MMLLRIFVIFIAFLSENSWSDDLKDRSTPWSERSARKDGLIPSEYLHPTMYTIELTMDANFGYFDAILDIDLMIGEQSISKFWLHAGTAVNITSMKILDWFNSTSFNFTFTRLADPHADVIEIEFIKHELLAKSKARIQMSFETKISNDLDTEKGLLLRKIEGSKVLTIANLEPNYARNVLPCFDHPSMKAILLLTVNVPNGYTALSNTPHSNILNSANRSSTTTVFQSTPPMPIHQLSLIVSNYTCTFGRYNELQDEIPLKVCSVEKFAPYRSYALKVLADVMDNMRKYMKVTFLKHDVGKVDLVALPETQRPTGSWGLIFIDSDIVLMKPDNLPMRYKMKLTSAIINAVAQFWYGNLVSIADWSDIPLVKGLARYMEYFLRLPAGNDPSEMEKLFALEVTQLAQELDLEASNDVALFNKNMSVVDLKSYPQPLIYEKGAAIFRMIDQFLEGGGMQLSLVHYFYERLFGFLSRDILVNVMEEQQRHGFSFMRIRKVMKNWFELPGYPVITAKIIDKEVALEQESFLPIKKPRKTDERDKWEIPIQYKISVSSQLSTIMADRKFNISHDFQMSDSWIMLNSKQMGFYRVNYTEELLNRLLTFIEKNRDAIPEENRAQLVDDYMTFYKTGRQPNLIYVLDKLARLLKNETSYYPWATFFKHFDTLYVSSRKAHFRAKFEKYVLDLMDNVYQNGTVNNQLKTYTDMLKEELLLKWACRLNHQDCVRRTKQYFDDYRTKSIPPPNHIRSVVFCTGLRQSGHETYAWNFLWNRYIDSAKDPAEELDILNALGCTTTYGLLHSILNKTIRMDANLRNVRVSRLHLIHMSIVDNYPENLDLFLGYLDRNMKELARMFNQVHNFKKVIDHMITRVDSDERVAKVQELAEKAPKRFEPIFRNVKDESVASLKRILNIRNQLDQMPKEKTAPVNWRMIVRIVGLLLLAVVLCAAGYYFRADLLEFWRWILNPNNFLRICFRRLI